jgi:hypothetical protein
MTSVCSCDVRSPTSELGVIDAAGQSRPARGVKGRAEGEARTLMSVQRFPLDTAQGRSAVLRS